MSAKWRALQRRHRYTYSSVVFPKPFIQTLDSLLSQEALSSSQFFSHLKQMTILTSTYAQISAVKDLTTSFARLLSTTPETNADIISTASQLYLEILFLENSLPLHRTLISALAKNRKYIPLIAKCFLELCEEYGDYSRKGRKRFAVSRAALSLMGFPKLGFLNEAIEKCADLAAVDVACGLECVIKDIDCGSWPSPIVMEQCQEAMSCLYYLLQRFPRKFVGSGGISNSFESIVRTILSVLRSLAFSRDCLVAAGVSFCAALQACMTMEELSSFISRGFFHFCGKGGEIGDLGAKKVLPNGDLYLEVQDFSVLSRLCLLRGILTAVPRPVLNILMTELSSGSVWTILYDGILPELCRYCENPIDSHFNFHALTVTQICLQQIKTSTLSDLTNIHDDYDPVPQDMTNRILRIIWNNLEDPLSQTVKQVHLIFDLLLDIESSLPSEEGNVRFKSFLWKIAADLLRLGPRCKGRYVPLASLTRRLSAKSLLELNPDLLFETAYAYRDDDVCCAATSFLKCFLECLRDECWSNDGIEKGYDSFRGLSLPPLLHGLISGNSKLRSNLNIYALPVILEVDTDSIFPMLAYISLGPGREENKVNGGLTINQCVAALVSLLKVARTLALIEGDIDLDSDSPRQEKVHDCVSVICIKGINVRVPVEWFILALTHADESLRLDAAESLFLNPKMASLPSSLELNLLRKAVPLNMRCCSTAFQMKWTSLFRKFFSRVRTALERLVKQGSWHPTACSNGSVDGSGHDVNGLLIHKAEDLFNFMRWLSCFLFYSCYPSAPYERKTIAMELILIMIDVWPISPRQKNQYLHPYSEGFTSVDSTLSLVGSIIDSWDRLRESSFRILLSFPTPLSGLCSHNSVKEVISWAKKLVCSPRVRESDAGALTFRLIFRKYVLDLGWFVGSIVNSVCVYSQSEFINGYHQDLDVKTPVGEHTSTPVGDYISALTEWLRIAVEEGEKDLSEACRKSFVHGILLTLRYTFEELDWNSEAFLSSSRQIRCLLEKLFELLMRVTSLALWVVSADVWSMPYDMDDTVDDESFFSDMAVEMDTAESFAEGVDKVSKAEDNGRPAEHVVMVGCWLAMKEVSLLLGTTIRKIPLPSSTVLDPSNTGYALSNADEVQMMTMHDSMIDMEQLEIIGNHFLQVLLKMKHNGAIDKTRAGFTALCNRLLCSNDPSLCKMTDSWMEQLMERTISKGQTVDDLLRRSAGIPAAFIALFLSEPEGTPKKLLPRALRWLVDIVNTSSCNMHEAGGNKSQLLNEAYVPDDAWMKSMPTEVNVARTASKIRNDGLIPTVHAFNALRAAFNDANLAADTSGFCAEALIASIQSFSSPYWEVRNSACLAYTALVRRMIGFLNVQKRESARRALTGLEFFHRYPALHPFLFSQLEIATEMLGDGCSKHTEPNIAKAIHPSLCPILILLSRLKPSLISSEADDALDPFLFMPFIRRCAMQNNLRVRALASRALTGLVSNEKLHVVISRIANGLPHGTHQMDKPTALCLDSSTLMNKSNEDITVTTPSTSFNSIHGILLQLSSLLDNNCRNLTDITKKDQILGVLIQVFLKCSWIGSQRLCPCPTLNSSFLWVLDQMLGIARAATSQHVATIQALLLELTSECLDVEETFLSRFYDPTKVELRRQAALSYFSCLFGGNLEDPEEVLQLKRSTPVTSYSFKMPEIGISVVGLQVRIRSCICDSTYEVRLATLKQLLLLVKSLKTDNDNIITFIWARTYLQSILMQLLAEEENPKCLYYVLKIFFSWNTMQLERSTDLMDDDSIFCFWDRLVQLNSTVMRVKTREIIICCMGICSKQLTRLLKRFIFVDLSQIKQEDVSDSTSIDQPTLWSKVYNCINSFIILVKLHGAPSQPVNIRKAVAESIIASGMLKEANFVASLVCDNQIADEELHSYDVTLKNCSEFEISKASNLYACKILDMWFVCIQLLEDEDVVLRQRLAKDVQKYVNSIEPNRSHCTNSVPMQVDLVIESTFEYLSSIFGHWLEYFNYLLRWTFDAASSVSGCGDLVRRIFDKEIDNHHEEKLLICHICCFNLEKLSVSKSWAVGVHPADHKGNNLEIFFQRWRIRFLRQLLSVASSSLETEGMTDWIGGIGNHKDTFMSLYANMLGLYALRQCPREENHSSEYSKLYLSEFTEFRRIMRAFLGNPLISNLYYLVTESHENIFGVSLTPTSTNDSLVWDNFDPYFLLK